MENMKQGANERTISISEIIWKLLEQWKVVACFAIIVSILFTGFMQKRYSRQKDAVISQQQQEKQSTPEDIVNSLPEEEQDAVINAYNMRQQLEYTEGYLRDSLVMKTDPYHARRFKMDWTINGTDEQRTILAESYMMYLKSDDLCQQLLPFFGDNVDIELVREAIFSTSMDQDVNGAFTCEVLLFEGTDEEGIQQVFPLAMEAAHKTISDKVGEHTTQCVSQGVVEGADLLLEQYQKRVYDRLSSIKGQLKTRTDELSLEQKEAYEQLDKGKEDVQIDIPSENRLISVRNILIGLILGVLLYVWLLFLYTLISGKIVGKRSLEGYGLYTLGEWYQEPSGKGISWLTKDRFIYRLHHKNCYDKEIKAQQTARAILNACKSDNKRLAFVISAPLSLAQDEFCNEVRNILIKKEVSANTVLTDQAYHLFDQYDVLDIGGIVLITVDGKTQFMSLNKILNQSSYYKVPVYGNIYVG